MPFNECAVDPIGPWAVQKHGKPYEFNALTAIDTVTNLVELVRIDNKSSEHVTQKFAQLWLARYPWPERCAHDKGGEFVGPEFQTLMQQCKIKDVTTTAGNPCSLLLDRDMLLQVPLIADWTAITIKREHLISENLTRDNKRQRQDDY